MTVKTGGAWAGTFVTKDATGALATPTTGPAGVLYVDGAANGATVTITGSNPYKWAVTLPSLTTGQRVDVYITATIATIATAAVVASEQADTALVSEVKTDTVAILLDTGTDGVIVASIATDAITAAAIKADAVTEIQNGLATPTNITAGTIATVTNLTNLPTMPADWITASGLKADAVAEIADGVLDEAMAGHVGAGTLGKAVADVLEDTGTTMPGNIQDIQDDIDTIGVDTTTEIPASIAAIDAKIDTIDNFIDTEVAAILADTNELQTDWANGGRLDLILDAAGAAGDPWSTALPGTYGAGTAGKALSDVLEDTSTTIPALFGTGAIVWTYTILDGSGNPIQDVLVQATSDITGTTLLQSAITNSAGVATFKLDAGTVYIWCYRAGYTFNNPDQETV